MQNKNDVYLNENYELVLCPTNKISYNGSNSRVVSGNFSQNGFIKGSGSAFKKYSQHNFMRKSEFIQMNLTRFGEFFPSWVVVAVENFDNDAYKDVVQFGYVIANGPLNEMIKIIERVYPGHVLNFVRKTVKSNNEKNVFGDFCDIRLFGENCRDSGVICKDFGRIKTDIPINVTAEDCVNINSECGHLNAHCWDFATIKSWSYSRITCKNRCFIEVGSTSNVLAYSNCNIKCGEWCNILSGTYSTINAKSGCNISARPYTSIKAKYGNNINLSGENYTIDVGNSNTINIKSGTNCHIEAGKDCRITLSGINNKIKADVGTEIIYKCLRGTDKQAKVYKETVGERLKPNVKYSDEDFEKL